MQASVTRDGIGDNGDTILHMRRMQVQLTDAQLAALEAKAAATGRPKAAVVRDAIELWRRGEERRRRYQRALEAVGGFRSGLHDVSTRHDDYLADAADEDLAKR